MTTYVEKWVPTLSQADWVLMCLRSRSALGGTDLAAADVITDFRLNQDKIDLISPLAFSELNIYQGTGAFVSDTIIQYQVTGEYLAILKGVAASSIVQLVTF
jgi:hypothetical protein